MVNIDLISIINNNKKIVLLFRIPKLTSSETECIKPLYSILALNLSKTSANVFLGGGSLIHFK